MKSRWCSRYVNVRLGLAKTMRVKSDAICRFNVFRCIVFVSYRSPIAVTYKDSYQKYNAMTIVT